MVEMWFRNRSDAGRRLAKIVDGSGVDVVVALPRGGVPVAAEIALAHGLPLDVLIVSKLTVPSHPQLGLGAIGESGVQLVNTELVEMAHVRPAVIDAAEARASDEVERRVRIYRRGRPMRSVDGHSVVLVDDGIASGWTAQVGIDVLRAMGARRVVLAVPVAAPRARDDLLGVADDVVCLDAPEQFMFVAQSYRDFGEVSDDDVAAILSDAATTSH